VAATATENLGFSSTTDFDIGLDNVQVTETPLPATLPLFATGLGALGLLGWRRKRKAAFALAAVWQPRSTSAIEEYVS